MLKIAALSVGALLMTAASSFAQQTTDRVKIEIDRASIQVIAQALMDQPFKVAAPILNEISKQLADQAPKPAVAPVAPPADPKN